MVLGATIVPKGHPKELARIEVYFEEPVGAKPGKAYAFRGQAHIDGGFDYARRYARFEYGYSNHYKKGFAVPEHRDCD